ncbi:unnamed protein product [Adineta ricciae]|uniref:Uncharacterized protein n=1 Tax=Adineta ricciae TaxID=249248 RepID=A0A814FWG5_ADIRI|nr:unnamed protein product [Adineta ricciae]
MAKNKDLDLRLTTTIKILAYVTCVKLLRNKSSAMLKLYILCSFARLSDEVFIEIECFVAINNKTISEYTEDLTSILYYGEIDETYIDIFVNH